MAHAARRALRAITALAGLSLAAGALAPRPARAQWSTTYEQFYLQAPHNWEFRNRYQAADRLFNGFDYGHAILYETLWRKPDAPASALEEQEYDHLTRKVLVKPPRVPLEEAAIEVEYAKLAPEAKQMFDWAHILHRQLYDVLADERLSQQQKDAEIGRLVAYYKTRPDLAFSSKPKSMALMQEQPYSLAFRKKYPKFNGLIWAYHWMQVGLYEPLLVGRTADERQAGVRATVARFWQMLGNAPSTMPYQMPMTAAVAPTFAERYPEAAIIFDNLHSMHDVVSDILANPAVPRNRKRAEILLAAQRFRDDTSYVMPVDAWRTMAQHMGVENMGGPAVGFLPQLPTPTVTYGAVMTHDDRTGEMTGFKYGSATGGAHAGHAANGSASGAAHDPAHMEQMMTLHWRIMADPVIRERMMADTAMRRMMNEMMDGMPTDHREHMRQMMQSDSGASSPPAARARTSAPRRATRRPAPGRMPSRQPARDPHGGHGTAPAADSEAAARAVAQTRGPAQVTVRGDAAWAVATSTVTGTFRGRPVDSVGAELMVLGRTADGWRITAVHWSSRRRG